MYDELIAELRQHHCDAKEDDTQEVCVECAYDVIIADKTKFSGIKSVCVCGLMHRAADAIEELSCRETPMQVRTTTSTKRCPSCNKQLSGIGNIHRNYQFCRWCGQALDWTEPPKEEGE